MHVCVISLMTLNDEAAWGVEISENVIHSLCGTFKVSKSHTSARICVFVFTPQINGLFLLYLVLCNVLLGWQQFDRTLRQERRSYLKLYSFTLETHYI